MNKKENDNIYRLLISIALVWVLIGVWSEVSQFWVSKHNWEKLLSLSGKVVIFTYLVLFVLGLVQLVAGAWNVSLLGRISSRMAIPGIRRGPVVAMLVVMFVYVHLYSVWQDILTTPWLLLLFVLTFSQIILFVVSPHREQRISWNEVSLALVLFLYPRMIQEFRLLFPGELIYRMATIIGMAFVLALVFAIYSTYNEKIRLALIAGREKIKAFRFLLIVILCLTPLIYRYLVIPETYGVYDDIRFAILLAATWSVAYISLTGTAQLVTRDAFGVSLGVLLFTDLLARSSFFVVDYPFTLYWSEGNRFYDYSLVFGQALYNHSGSLVNPYGAIGRYALWGVLFLWDGLPIWAHRLWNLVLQTLPVLIFAWLLTRKLKPAPLRYGMMLWITLFLTVLAPLHPPFIVASIISILFAFDKNPVRRGITLVFASIYVGLSRWTWVLAPAAIGALIDLLLYYPARQGSFWRRVMPTVMLVVVSVIAGLLPSLGDYMALAQGTSMTVSQPLLWYRLLPNDTLGSGVLLLVLMYTVPVLSILAWQFFNRKIQLDWLQRAAVWGTLTGFFIVGLVISTKIGGGGDLHNLDMYLINLLVLAVIGLMLQNEARIHLPVWAVGLIFIAILTTAYDFMPLNPGSSHLSILDLPDKHETAETLSIVQEEVAHYAKNGDVLLIDHRQLLTFGYLPAIPFIPDYEKKYMMDQAMGNNADYFRTYYNDLAAKRFTLIVTEPLRSVSKEEIGGPFSEENDAWVLWVSNPTLCFYEPIYESKATNVELLVPKQNPVGCDEYLK